jgi:hypothetical protein
LDHLDLANLQNPNIDLSKVAAVPMTPEMRRHVHSYMTRVCLPEMGNVRSKEIWTALERGFGDPLLIFPIVMISIIQERDGKLPKPLKYSVANSNVPSSFPDFFSIKSKSIHVINEALSDPLRAICDSMIWALYHLIVVETFLGSREEVLLHAEGLSQIVKLRGGLQSLSIDLQFGMALTDVKVTYAWHSHPTLSPPIVKHRVESSEFGSLMLNAEQAGNLNHYPAARLLGFALRGFDPNLDPTFRNLRGIALFHLYSSTVEGRVTEEDASYFRNLTLAVEYKLITLLLQSSNALEERMAKIENSCLIVCSMVINLVWCPWYRISWIIPSLLRDLKTTLGESKTLFISFRDYEDVLLWILFLGSHCSEGQILRPWFSTQVSQCLSILKLASWEETQKTLVEFLYEEEAFGYSFGNIFAEAQLLLDDKD